MPYAVRSRRARSAFRVLSGACALTASLTAAPLYAQLWTGLGANSNWSTPQNWLTNTPPALNGATVSFLGTTRTTNSPDLAYAVQGITFLSDPSVNPWTLTGTQTLTLGGNGIANFNNDAATISVPLALSANSLLQALGSASPINLTTASAGLNLNAFTLSVLTGSNTFTLQHAVSGSGGVTKFDPGTLAYTGNLVNTYTGPTTVSAGLLTLSRNKGNPGDLNGPALFGPLVINSGATVRIDQVEQIRDSAPVTVNAGGTLSLQSQLETIAAINLAAGAAVTYNAGSTLRIADGPGTVSFTGAAGDPAAGAAFSANFHAGLTQRSITLAAGTHSFFGSFTAPAGIDVSGTGTLYISPVSADRTAALSGSLRVQSGTVFIGGSTQDPLLFSGTDLTVGIPAPAVLPVPYLVLPASLTIQNSAPFQSLTTVNLTLNTGGNLTFNSFNTSVGFASVSTFSRSTLTFSGGGSSNLALLGAYTHTANDPASPFTLASGSATPLTLNLGTSAKTFTVTNPSLPAGSVSASPDLIVNALITSSPTGGIVKAGNGGLRLVPRIGSSLGSLNATGGSVFIDATNSPLFTAPTAPLSLTSATLTLTGGPLTGGPLTAPRADLTATDSLATITLGGQLALNNLTLNSSTLDFLNAGNVLSVAGSITAAQIPGKAIPFLDGFGLAPLVLATTVLPIAVNTASNAGSGTTGDLVLRAPLASSSAVSLLKVGPGQLFWQANDFTLNGALNVGGGTVVLSPINPGTNGLTGTLSLTAQQGFTARVVTLADALAPTLNVVLNPNGTLALGADDAVNALTLRGARLTTSTFSPGLRTLTTNSLTLDANNATTSLETDLVVTSRVVTLDSTSAVLPSLLFARFTAPTATPTAYTVTGTGLLTTALSPDTPAGTPFPGSITVSNRAVLELSRPGPAFPLTGLTPPALTVNASTASVITRSPGQLPPGATLSLLAGTLRLLSPTTSSAPDESVGALILRDAASLTSSYTSALSTANAVAANQFNVIIPTAGITAPSVVGVPLTVASSAFLEGPAEFRRPVTFGGPFNVSTTAGTVTFTAPATFSGPAGFTAASVNFLAPATFFAPASFTAGTLSLFDAGAVDNRSTLTLSNTTLNLTFATLTNRGTLTGTYTLTGTNGTLDNRGTLVPPTLLTVGPSLTLANNASIDLAGRTLRAQANTVSGTFRNNAAATLTGPGLLDLSPAFSNAGTLVAPAGATTFLANFTNAGTARLTSPSASLAAPTLTNTGRLSGDGTLALDLLLNRGTLEPSPSGQITLTGRLSNSPTGVVSLPAGSALVLASSPDPIDGLVSLAGGTLQVLPSTGLSLTGRLTGYGTLASPSTLLNILGTITFAGGTSTLNLPLANFPGRSLRVQAGTALFNFPVTNDGSLTAGPGGYAVFTSTTTGVAARSPDGDPTAAPAPNPLLGLGTLTLTGSTVLTDGLTQATVVLAGTPAAPTTLQITSREPNATIPSTGRTAPPSLSIISNLFYAGPLTTSGVFDLTTNDLLLRSPVAVANLLLAQEYVRTYLTTNGAAGLGTSSPTPFTTLAVFPNSTGPTPGLGAAYFDTIAGLPALPTDVLVRFTYLGDTDLDGAVTSRDLANLLEGLTTARTGWRYGDLNYDGTVNTTDLQLFNTAYAALRNAPSLGSPSDYTPPNSGGGAIPEPAAAITLAAALALATRRRR